MANFFNNLFGGASTTPSAVPLVADSDFADFASVPDPSPVPIVSVATSETLGAAISSTTGVGFVKPALPRPYTKWYRVWERVYLVDFYTEMFIVPFLVLLVLIHIWGSRKNRAKAKAWLIANGPVLQQEFAVVGFNGERTNINAEVLAGRDIPQYVLKQKTASEFISYATGRQNVAFLDIKLTLAKRYNPVGRLGENILGLAIESMPAPVERLEATSYVFDGRESDLVLPSTAAGSEQKREKFSSTYDDFVWAIVHKDAMQFWRNSRYDLSLTVTRDHPKLPSWAVIMSESAEITEALLNDDLVKAVHDAGDALEALVVSDQPVDKPLRLNDAVSKKRISLMMHVPAGTDSAAYSSTIPIFTQFLRLPDLLVNVAHFRPEITRKIKATREEEVKKIKKLDDVEKAEERRIKVEREKKKERDEKLRGLNSEEQKKFLEKERAADMRKGQKKRTMKA